MSDNRYSRADEVEFTADSIPAGTEVEVQISGFKERMAKDVPVIEQKATITAIMTVKNPDDLEDIQNSSIGKVMTLATFFGPNNGLNIRDIRKMFREGGFEEKDWKPDSDTPAREMLPAALKYLSLKGGRCVGVVTAGKAKAEGSVPHYFNLRRISRVDEYGKKHEDALPDVVTNEELREAWGEVVPGEQPAEVY